MWEATLRANPASALIQRESMKTREEIEEALHVLPSTADISKYPGMSYESGWEEALLWVLGEEDVEYPFEGLHPQ